jgi:hypothetical protein
VWNAELTLVIAATQEVEIKRITVQDQPWQKVSKTSSQPKTGHGGVHLSSQLLGGVIGTPGKKKKKKR